MLLIIALLAAATMPAFNSAVNEHRVREDGHQLAMMVRSAMIESTEQHRPYIIELTKFRCRSIRKANLPRKSDDPDATLFKDSGSTNSDQPVEDTVTEDVEVEKQLEAANKLQHPTRARPTAGWTCPATDYSGCSSRGGLCAATPVRIARGDAYLE